MAINKANKIRALMLKTVANGATKHEEESAKKALEKLLSKKEEPTVSSIPKNIFVSPKAKEPEISQGELFRKYWPDGVITMTSSSIQMNAKHIDWDILAGKNLIYSYADYLRETAIIWENYNKTRLGVTDKPSEKMTQDEYNTKCAYVFKYLYLKEKGLE